MNDSISDYFERGNKTPDEESRELLEFVERCIHRRAPKRTAQMIGESRVGPVAEAMREEVRRTATADMANALMSVDNVIEYHDEAKDIADQIYAAIARGDIPNVRIEY